MALGSNLCGFGKKKNKNMKILNTEEFEQNNGFLSHFMIEMYYGDEYRNFYYTMEPVMHGGVLLERYGVFDECYPLSYVVYDFIKKHGLKKGETKTIKVTSTLTKKIELYVMENGIDLAEYKMKSSKYEKGNDCFDKISIGLSEEMCNKPTMSVIMHELQHAKEDLELRKKGSSLVDVFIKTGYDKVVNNKNIDDFELILKNILYFFSSFEKNAYVAQFRGELEDNKNLTFYEVKNVYDFIKNTNLYKIYEEVFSLCNFLLNNITSEKNKQHIVELTNKLSYNNFRTFEQLKKWLNEKCWKCKRKFDKILPKMAYDFYKDILPKGLGKPPVKNGYSKFYEKNLEGYTEEYGELLTLLRKNGFIEN